jgi:hypothetical protein
VFLECYDAAGAASVLQHLLSMHIISILVKWKMSGGVDEEQQ